MSVFQDLYTLLCLPFVEFSFMRRALVGAVALSLGAAPVGIFLMLRRMSLLGDAMAHAILPGAALGYLMAGLSLGFMTAGGLVAGMIIALAAGLVSRVTTINDDAALAAFYLLSLAAGIVLISVKGSSVDLLHVLFGSILALDNPTLILLASASTLSCLAIATLFRRLVLESVDPDFAHLVDRGTIFTNGLFLALVAVNLVAGFHALGTLLAVGLMMLPAFIARFWAHSLIGMITIAILAGWLSSVMGILLSFHFNIPTGPTIILSCGMIYGLSLLFGRRERSSLAFHPAVS